MFCNFDFASEVRSRLYTKVKLDTNFCYIEVKIKFNIISSNRLNHVVFLPKSKQFFLMLLATHAFNFSRVKVFKL